MKPEFQSAPESSTFIFFGNIYILAARIGGCLCARVFIFSPFASVQCLTGLQQCGRPEAVELVSLLGRYEMEGLLYAHDRIAEVSAISSAPLSDANLCGEDADAMPESAFISSSSHLPGHSPAHSAGGSSQHHQDRTFKVISLEKSNEPLVSSILFQ